MEIRLPSQLPGNLHDTTPLLTTRQLDDNENSDSLDNFLFDDVNLLEQACSSPAIIDLPRPPHPDDYPDFESTFQQPDSSPKLDLN